MKKMKIMILVFVLFTIAGFASGQEKKTQLSFLAGFNHTFECGSEDDYLAGENDFPVTPAHTSPNISLCFGYFFKKNMGLELDGAINFRSRVRLEDPSDQDTVEINTSAHYSITLNFIYMFLGGNLRPYLIAGGGIDKLSVKDESYTSEYGYVVEFSAPDRAIDPMANMGFGIYYFLNPRLGLRFDIRYGVIFADPNNINSLSVMAGASWRF
jgi:outer membrane protein W